MTTMPPPSSPTLRRVLANDLCSGCGLCAGVSGGAIEIAVSADGYNRPLQHRPVSEEAEHTIATACPGSVVAPWPSDVDVHPFWGAHHQVAVGHATDEQLRHYASSGGMISALLIHALQSGMIDAVIQVIADPEQPTQNIISVSHTSAEIAAASGSRYAASSPLAVIEPMLAGSERYGFVGKPCDVSALRQLAKVDARVADRIPLALSFFCGGIPSRRSKDQLLRAMGVTEEAELARFRYRGDGWPGQATATRHDGSEARIGYMESWGAHLSKTLQFRCKICPDAVGGSADIACADAWYGDARGYPLFEEKDGRSAVLARTRAGAELLTGAIEAGRVMTELLSIEELDKMQPSQAKRKRLILSRWTALRLAGRKVPRGRGLALVRAAQRAGILESGKSAAGMVRRLLMRS